MTTELKHLRALRDFRAEDGAPDPDARAAARVALLERIEAAVPAPAQRPIEPRARRPRLLAAALGFAAAGAAAFALVAGLGSGGVQPATAAEVLQQAADAAANGPGVTLGAGQYWYASSESSSLSSVTAAKTFHVRLRVRHETWFDRDGVGRVLQHGIGEPEFPTPADRRAWVASGRPDLANGDMNADFGDVNTAGQRAPYPFFPEPLTYDQLQALPTNVDALYARIEHAGQAWASQPGRKPGDAPQEMFTIVGDLLRLAPAQPALRSALYGVAARIPGIKLLGDVQDARGRAGVAVAFTAYGQRNELTFDPDTATLLAERTVRTSTGEPVWESLYLGSGVVDSTDARP